MKLLRALFVADWKRKIVAIGLAFAIWWYVDALLAVDRSYSLRVVVAEGRVTPEDGTIAVVVPPGWTLVEPRPGESVGLKLHGSPANLDSFTARQFAAYFEARTPAIDSARVEFSQDVAPSDLEWRRPEEAAQLLAGVTDLQSLRFLRFVRLTQRVLDLRHELLFIESEVRPEYEVMRFDARFDLSQATLSGPQRLIEAALEEVSRAIREPESGSDLLEPIVLQQSTRLDAVVMLRLAEDWRVQGLHMEPEWVRVTIPVRLLAQSTHVWSPPLQVLQGGATRWQVPAYAANWRASLRYEALPAGFPFGGWVEEHVLLLLPLLHLRAEGLDVTDARIEWTLVGVDDPATRAAVLDALVVEPVNPEQRSLTVTRIP